MRIYRYKMSRIEAIYRATTQENGWYLGRGWGGGGERRSGGFENFLKLILVMARQP